jgi:hypothetical protein
MNRRAVTFLLFALLLLFVGGMLIAADVLYKLSNNKKLKRPFESWQGRHFRIPIAVNLNSNENGAVDIDVRPIEENITSIVRSFYSDAKLSRINMTGKVESRGTVFSEMRLDYVATNCGMTLSETDENLGYKYLMITVPIDHESNTVDDLRCTTIKAEYYTIAKDVEDYRGWDSSNVEAIKAVAAYFIGRDIKSISLYAKMRTFFDLNLGGHWNALVDFNDDSILCVEVDRKTGAVVKVREPIASDFHEINPERGFGIDWERVDRISEINAKDISSGTAGMQR